MRILKSMKIAAALTALVLTASACGSDDPDESASGSDPTESETTQSSTDPESDPLTIKVGEMNFDFADYCGDKPVSVGILDVIGSNAWAVGKRAMLESFLDECPNVTDVQYVDSGGDVQKYIAAVNSFVAQGVNVIATPAFLGQAVVPALSNAVRRGALVGGGNAIPGDATVPDDLTSVVVPDFDKTAAAWVEFLTEATDNKGKIAYVGGPAGNLFDGPAFEAVQKAIEDQGSGIELVTPEPLAGNWDPATGQQVMTGFLQKEDDVDGVIMSNNASGPAIYRAFESAGVPLPVIVGQSSSMELVCTFADKLKDNPDLDLLSLDATANLDVIALAKMLSVWSGNDAPELGPNDGFTQVEYARYIDTLGDIVPECDPSLPPGADLSMALDKEDMVAALQ